MSAIAITLVIALIGTAQARAQATPTAPANGAQVTGDDVVLNWALEPGWTLELRGVGVAVGDSLSGRSVPCP